MAEITSPYESPDGTLDDSTHDLSSFRKTPLELTTTDDGRILRLVANKDLYPTVADRTGLLALFKKQQVEIVRLGNDAANLNSKTFMLGLLFALSDYGCLNTIDSAETEGGNAIIPITELEIIPITFIDRSKPYEGQASVEEQPGLLWMAKHKELPEDSAAMWHYNIPIKDARWVEWFIIPIDPIPSEMQCGKIINQDNWIRTPDWTFELKIRSPGDAPDPPIRPGSRGPGMFRQ